MPKAKKVRKSVPKDENMCQKLGKCAKSRESVPKAEKVCQMLNAKAKKV